MFGLKKPIPRPERPIIGQCYQGKDGKKLGKYIGEQVKSEFFKGHIADGDDTEYKTIYLIFSDNGKNNEVPASDYIYYHDRVVPCSSGGRRRMRKTRKGGYDPAGPPPNQLTPARLGEITRHLIRAEGKGELENVISDLSDVRRLDPEIFADRGGLNPGDDLDGIIEYMEEDEANVDEIRVDLEDIIDMLAVALDERPPRGARRGRKSRRKTLRQRK
jgi:hypothetical protein